jgi:glucose/arabinose dehydrogenase
MTLIRSIAPLVWAPLALWVAAPASWGAPAPVRATGLALETVAQGLEDPLYLTAPAGDSRLFVVEQAGRIRIIKDGRLLPRPFLDLTDRVRSGGERGLLSVAFHPRYVSNGFLYVNYTDARGNTQIERYSVSRDPDRADPSSAHRILSVDQPFANHNGGLVMFGPDGMLYVGMGDGGSGGDPFGNGQKRSTLLGKLLRLDVDRGDPYAVPHDNPFAGRRGMRAEIWAYGLRNPWRFCFDRAAGLLYVADVGQNRWEEIDIAPLGAAGLDYGWNVMEGTHCFRSEHCETRGRLAPVVEYGHDEGCSVTGGFVYRGRRMAALVGHYIYADYCRGWIRSFKYAGGAVSEHREWQGAEPGEVMSFGEDAAGELYVCSQNGRVYRLVWPAPGSPPGR